MKVLVAGAKGMLGTAVVFAAGAVGHTVNVAGHDGMRVQDFGAVQGRINRVIRPDIVINCAGKLPGSKPVDMVAANTLGPHVLARVCKDEGVGLINVSTDCVFSGRRPAGDGYTTSDLPDPDTLYGRTKLAGEPSGPGVMNVRTSFIGPDHGLLHWFVNADRDGLASVDGWSRAYWSGGYVLDVAVALVDLAGWSDPPPNVVHLSTRQAISKAALLGLIKETFRLKIDVIPVDEPTVNRALRPTVELPAIEDSLTKLRELLVAH